MDDYRDKEKAMQAVKYVQYFCVWWRGDHDNDCRGCPFVRDNGADCSIEKPLIWYVPALLETKK